MFSFLPVPVKEVISQYNPDGIYELRVRVNSPLGILVNGKYELKEYKRGQTVTKEDLKTALLRITEHSVYAHSETIKRGYVTTKFGLRVGFGGECVVENGKVNIIKEVTSLCVRVPHEMKGIAGNLVESLFSEGIVSCLVISPPGVGKTTMLRDMIRVLSEKFGYNLLVVDERMEISAKGCFDLGKTTDVLSGAPKEYGFEYGVKNMRPDIIAVDELMTESDVLGAVNATLSGVGVIATVHGNNLSDVRQKNIFKYAFENKIFDKAVVLQISKSGSRLYTTVNL